MVNVGKYIMINYMNHESYEIIMRFIYYLSSF